MDCARCDQPIPPERLEILPDTKVCVACVMKDGDVPMKKGRMAYGHKTAGEIDIMSPEQYERVNDLDPRGYFKRGGGVQE